MHPRLAAALRRTLRFMRIVVALSILSLPFTVPFAFDAPGTTWADVVPTLVMFYLLFVVLPWFLLALAFSLVRGR